MGVDLTRLPARVQAEIARQQRSLAPTRRTRPCIERGGEHSYTIPWPPSVNHYWRQHVVGGYARVILSAEARAFRAAVVAALGDAPTFGTRRGLSLTLELHPPTNAAIDLDNRIKAAQDSLAYAGVYEDDRQIDELHVFRRPKLPGGRAVVTIRDCGSAATLFEETDA